MNTVYYETIDKLEKMGVNPDYVQGWAGGFSAIQKEKSSASQMPTRRVMRMVRTRRPTVRPTGKKVNF